MFDKMIYETLMARWIMNSLTDDPEEEDIDVTMDMAYARMRCAVRIWNELRSMESEVSSSQVGYQYSNGLHSDLSDFSETNEIEAEMARNGGVSRGKMAVRNMLIEWVVKENTEAPWRP